ncbi:serine/threonine-protein phosphatase 7 long form isoform X1 [Cinnamomum micranthum f. kanehirae]|uniref:Serine/threonine-protein phosphatase 7 long form isoform X1 n=1 Tax=Cinnamomum micranthum f. kanehirae TaxID=337451 RepID=A0A443NNS0_9MAGN|nr:serine/threonine-protein phosphatase 7 long form isoform X1 [Cinnamomum micranthum f. kanehirae]
MLFGEMAITLDDVSTILGIPVTGKSVSVDPLSFERSKILAEHGLGITSQQAHEELVDKSGMRVPVLYLRLLMNFDEARKYAWGAAAPAHLYQQLWFAARSGVRQIAGYLTLLEAWIYEHFPKCRPHQNRTYTENLPRVHCWVP